MKKRLIVLFALASFVVSCAPQTAEVEPPPVEAAPVLYEHIVSEGETLGIIASWYTGKTANWREILNFNPELLPEKMAIGDKVFIPEELMVRKDPLPKTLVIKAQQNLRKPNGNSQTSVDSLREQDGTLKEGYSANEAEVKALLLELESEEEKIEPNLDKQLQERAKEIEDSSASQPLVVKEVQDEKRNVEEKVEDKKEAMTTDEPVQPAQANQGNSERDQLLEELLNQ